MCGARGHRNGKTRTSLSTTRMLRLTGPLMFRSFWPRTTWQWSPIPHTHPIWPPVTFSSSPSWRVEDSTPLKRFKRNRSGYLTQFQKGTSRDACKHGRNAGTAVFMQKGSTLKVMEEFKIQGKQTSFYKYCPGTFGYTLVEALGHQHSPTEWCLFIDLGFKDHCSLAWLQICYFLCEWDGKAVPLQAWGGPEGSRKLRVPDFMTMALDGSKVVSLTHWPPLPPGNTLGTHFC